MLGRTVVRRVEVPVPVLVLPHRGMSRQWIVRMGVIPMLVFMRMRMLVVMHMGMAMRVHHVAVLMLVAVSMPVRVAVQMDVSVAVRHVVVVAHGFPCVAGLRASKARPCAPARDPDRADSATQRAPLLPANHPAVVPSRPR
jgi:hypothetical protein